MMTTTTTILIMTIGWITRFDHHCRNYMCRTFYVDGFSIRKGGGGVGAGNLISSVDQDRFVATCPCPIEDIMKFDSFKDYSSQKGDDKQNRNKDDTCWVAVYRSNGNQPSIQLDVRDEFFNAMKHNCRELQGFHHPTCRE